MFEYYSYFILIMNRKNKTYSSNSDLKAFVSKIKIFRETLLTVEQITLVILVFFDEKVLKFAA